MTNEALLSPSPSSPSVGQFPRTPGLPAQSPQFWVTHKDRYLRQLLIGDLEEESGRSLVVYFTDCDRTDAQIDQGDDVYLTEVLLPCAGRPVDLLLETNGGSTDATEKLCSILRAAAPDLRVLVPRRAKSNGTVLALCGTEVAMGVESELGPIDPSLGGVPVQFMLNAPAGTLNPIQVQAAQAARDQTKKLAKTLLMTGMLAGKPEVEIDALVSKIATRDHYHSHGSSIDASEVAKLGLKVTNFRPDDAWWRKIWLLRSMYQYDCGVAGYSKLFEGCKASTAVAAAQPPRSSP